MPPRQKHNYVDLAGESPTASPHLAPSSPSVGSPAPGSRALLDATLPLHNPFASSLDRNDVAGLSFHTSSSADPPFANQPSSLPLFFPNAPAPRRSSSASIVPLFGRVGYGSPVTSTLPSVDASAVRAAYPSPGIGHSGNMSPFLGENPSPYLGDSPSLFSIASLPSDEMISAEPTLWARPSAEAEGARDPDDWLHEDKAGEKADGSGAVLTRRGCINLGFLVLLALAILVMFVGYPVLTLFQRKAASSDAIRSEADWPLISNALGLIDKDTPLSAHTRLADNGEVWDLVFSDEFEQDGRTFYEGDDPYWLAEDYHAWATNDLEWYDPAMVKTRNGSLVVTLDNRPSHDLNFTGGQLTSWNKFCFTGGRIEASVRLPGRPDVMGLWPAVWTLGNLGRIGRGGTLDGLWPYSYDACDAGTLKNQTLNGLPAISTTSGNDAVTKNALSYLPGQRLSRCTCTNDPTHPGPRHPDGSFVGRSAPEIDVLEAQTDGSLLIGQVSQSSQWAPFNPHYTWQNKTHGTIFNSTISSLNTYQGGVYQQSSSVVSTTNQKCYQFDSGGQTGGCFAVYAFEYQPGTDGYITWFNDDVKAWRYTGGGFPEDREAQVSDRPVPEEPLYLIINLAISMNFGVIDWERLLPLWPVEMEVDYVRVYQPPHAKNIGCDPPDRPTSAYIARYSEGYANANITTWEQMTNDPKPLNRLESTCS